MGLELGKRDDAVAFRDCFCDGKFFVLPAFRKLLFDAFLEIRQGDSKFVGDVGKPRLFARGGGATKSRGIAVTEFCAR